MHHNVHYVCIKPRINDISSWQRVCHGYVSASFTQQACTLASFAQQAYTLVSFAQQVCTQQTYPLNFQEDSLINVTSH